MGPTRRRLAFATLGVLVVSASLAAAAPQAKWQRAPQLPAPRTEVAAAAYKGGVVIVGGFAADGSTSSRVDLYQPAKRRWRRLPNLPVVVNHAMAAAAGGKLYVVGGYAQGIGLPRRDAFVFDGTRWTRLATMPDGRAAAGAAIAGGKLYVVGGISLGAGDLAREALVLDLTTGSWSSVPGPTPREHLAAASANGLVYALAGRLGDLSSNLDTFEVFAPATGSWTKLAPVPYRRGGTGAALSRGMIVSIGGEEEGGTIGSVYGYDLAAQRWRKLPSLPTPRHGLGVVALKNRVFAVAGGTSPGLTVSGANEVLDLSR
jgi:N-acetylneuraminic acid mutarotase